jgi:hypothetical protein
VPFESGPIFTDVRAGFTINQREKFMSKQIETSFLPVEAGNHLVLTDSKKYETRAG